MERIYNGALPEGYRTYFNLYRKLNDEGVLNNDQITFDLLDNIHLNHKTYIFDIDYIKARCFDEFVEHYASFTLSELQQINKALFHLNDLMVITGERRSTMQKVSYFIGVKANLREIGERDWDFI